MMIRKKFGRLVASIVAASLMLFVVIGSGPARALSMTDYLENKIIDAMFRGQAYTMPTTIWIGLSTTACSDSATGTEVTGGSYARVSIASTLANWAGTQSAGSTVASTGTSGTTSNNIVLTYPAPTAAWGSVGWMVFYDAASAGNALFCTALTQAKTINNGDSAPSFAIGAATVQIDN